MLLVKFVQSIIQLCTQAVLCGADVLKYGQDLRQNLTRSPEE